MQCIINFDGVGGKKQPLQQKEESIWSSKTCYMFEMLVEKSLGTIEMFLQ